MFHYYEKEDVHPAAAQWLVEHGYTYDHEIKMPIRGRADFSATHLTDGHRLIIECKSHSENIEKTINQVLGYCKQFSPAPYAAIAIPVTKVNDQVRQLCALNNIQLIELNIILDESRPVRQRKENMPKLLYTSLITICQEKSINKITVSDVAKQAGIHRITFHNYFQNVYELLLIGSDEVFSEFCGNWEAVHPTLSPSSDHLLAFSQVFHRHIAQYADVYRVMLVQPGIGTFINRVYFYVGQNIETYIKSCFPAQLIADSPIHIIAHREAGALLGMISVWLETGLKETPEEMAHLYYKSGHRGIWDALGIAPPDVMAG